MSDPQKEMWREHSIVLNQVGWKIAVALGYITEGQSRLEGAAILDLVDELIAKAADA